MLTDLGMLPAMQGHEPLGPQQFLTSGGTGVDMAGQRKSIMKLFPVLAAIGLLWCTACGRLDPAAPPTRTAPAVTSSPQPNPEDLPPSPKPFDPADIGKDAEPLPELPKADPKSDVKP